METTAMKKIISLLLILAIVPSIFGITAFAENRSVKGEDLIEDPDLIIHENYFPKDYIGYRYPVLPGTSEWPYGDHQKMVDACQILETVYQNMTTEELSQTILAYPLNADMFAYNSSKMGFSIVKEHFDGLQEFCDRTDSASYLIDLYSKQELVMESDLDEATLQAFESNDSIATTEIGKKACRQIFNTMAISLLLTQDEFTEKMTPLDKLNLANIIYDRSAIVSQELKESESEINDPTRAGTPVSYFCYYGLSYVSSSTVKTPKGGSMGGCIYNALEVWLYSDGSLDIRELPDLSNDATTAFNTENFNIYGLNPITGSGPTVKYNCHSYAWYKQTAPEYWINKFSTYGYTLKTLQSVSDGGIAVYHSNTESSSVPMHSAIITYKFVLQNTVIDLILTSKWGSSGLYLHTLANCPYYYIFYIPMVGPQPCYMKYYN